MCHVNPIIRPYFITSPVQVVAKRRCNVFPYFLFGFAGTS